MLNLNILIKLADPLAQQTFIIIFLWKRLNNRRELIKPIGNSSIPNCLENTIF